MAGKTKEFSKIMNDAGTVYRNVQDGGDCLNKGLILDFIGGDLDDELNAAVSEHIAECETCQLVSFDLQVEESAFRRKLEQDPDAVLATMLGSRGADFFAAAPTSATASAAADFVERTISDIKESIIAWVSPLWEPLYAGQPVTAADLQEQSRLFEMDYGEYIDLNCYWQGREKNAAPYIRLRWRVNLITPGTLLARFTDPETGSVYGELPLGDELEGEAIFTYDALGFDPTLKKWAVSIIVAHDSTGDAG